MSENNNKSKGCKQCFKFCERWYSGGKCFFHCHCSPPTNPTDTECKSCGGTLPHSPAPKSEECEHSNQKTACLGCYNSQPVSPREEESKEKCGCETRFGGTIIDTSDCPVHLPPSLSKEKEEVGQFRFKDTKENVKGEVLIKDYYDWLATNAANLEVFTGKNWVDFIEPISKEKEGWEGWEIEFEKLPMFTKKLAKIEGGVVYERYFMIDKAFIRQSHQDLKDELVREIEGIKSTKINEDYFEGMQDTKRHIIHLIKQGNK
jgi:hypothetical protein